MIRKQFYFTPEQIAKIKRLAVAWECSESEVIRRALRQYLGLPPKEVTKR
jgi:hypothetical protein